MSKLANYMEEDSKACSSGLPCNSKSSWVVHDPGWTDSKKETSWLHFWFVVDAYAEQLALHHSEAAKKFQTKIAVKMFAITL